MEQWILPKGFENFLFLPVLSIPLDSMVAFHKFHDSEQIARRRLYYFKDNSFYCLDPLGRMISSTADHFLNSEDFPEDSFDIELPLPRRTTWQKGIKHHALCIEGPRESKPFAKIQADVGQTITTNGYCTWDIFENIKIREREERSGRNKQKQRFVDEYVTPLDRAKCVYYGVQVLRDTAERTRTRYECMIALDIEVVNYDGAIDVIYVHAWRKIVPFPPSEYHSKLLKTDPIPELDMYWQKMLETAIRRYRFCFSPSKTPIAF